MSVIGDKRRAQDTLTTADDPEFAEIVATGGRQAQIDALQNPSFYDQETEELYSWFETETNRRGLKVAA